MKLGKKKIEKSQLNHTTRALTELLSKKLALAEHQRRAPTDRGQHWT